MKREKILCPSLMNLSVGDLKEELKKINTLDVDILHLDLMDGTYVPNFGMSLREINFVRENTDKVIDCHMMIMEPRRYIKTLCDIGCDIIYIHPDSETIPSESLDYIHSLGKKCGIVINPCNSFEYIKPLLYQVDYAMLMGVNPGYAGRSFLNYVLPKFKEISDFRNQSNLNFYLILDGGADREVISNLYHNYDIEGYVLGKQEFFFQQRSYEESVKMIRDL